MTQDMWDQRWACRRSGAAVPPPACWPKPAACRARAAALTFVHCGLTPAAKGLPVCLPRRGEGSRALFGALVFDPPPPCPPAPPGPAQAGEDPDLLRARHRGGADPHRAGRPPPPSGSPGSCSALLPCSTHRLCFPKPGCVHASHAHVSLASPPGCLAAASTANVPTVVHPSLPVPLSPPPSLPPFRAWTSPSPATAAARAAAAATRRTCCRR